MRFHWFDFIKTHCHYSIALQQTQGHYPVDRGDLIEAHA